MIFYVKKLKDGFHGKQWGPFIFILKRCKDDKGLEVHEKVHTKQWWTKGLFIHSLRYKFSHDYRYESELEAYIKQMEHCSDKKKALHHFAGFMSCRYKFKYSLDKILDDLMESIPYYCEKRT